jgi:anti-sigma B factor antagonist
VPITDVQIHDGLLAVQQTSEGERLRVALAGEMDLANAETAGSTLREVLLRDKDVVVDLGGLEFIDSTGLAMLVVAMREGGRRLSFLPSRHAAVRRLLSLTGLDERMNFSPPPATGVSAEDSGAEPLVSAA